MNQEQAQERIEELKGYYSHIGAYVAVNIFLIIIYFVNYDGSHWFVYPLFGWGIGLAMHTFQVFATGAKWEDRKMEELTGWKNTQDELDRLADRTDTLIAILSSIEWDKIDPDLLQTKENLQKAHRQIVDMQAGKPASNNQKVEVQKEIEKLEEFVTSTKFKYYDQAASNSK